MVCVVGFASLGMRVFMIAVFVRRARLQRLLTSVREAFEADPVLLEGATLVAGTVEYERGAHEAVSVRVEPAGSNYRDSGLPPGWLLAPAAGQPMRLASKPEDAVHLNRLLDRHTVTLLLALALLVVVQFISQGHQRQLWFGHATHATVVDRQTSTGPGSHGTTLATYRLHIRCDDGSCDFTDEVDEDAQLGMGDEVDVRVAPGAPPTLGREARASIPGIIIAALLIAGLWGFATAMLHRRTPWREGKLVESGSGRLSGSS